MAHQRKDAKASVFEDLFSYTDNLLRLYRALHPEDTASTAKDLQNITLDHILTTCIHNDLGFTVGDRLMILVEAQSTWTANIIPRIILYLAQTWTRYFEARKFNLYSSTPIDIPKPEFYVIYTGDKKIDKDSISLSEEFFGGQKTSLDATVKIFRNDCNPDIIGEYIFFCKTLDTRRKLYPNDGKRAILETIRICIEANKLKSYLENRKKEVVDIMMYIFDQETVSRLAIEEAKQKALITGRAEGEIKGTIQSIHSLMESLKLTADQAMNALKIPKEEQAKYLSLLKLQ